MGDILRGNSSTDKLNLSHGCKLSNFVVKPKKGTAVMWYNHLLNETDGWMGEMDLFSLHGGCNVITGEKWVCNMWIPAPYGSNKEMPSIYLNWKDFHLAANEAGKWIYDNRSTVKPAFNKPHLRPAFNDPVFNDPAYNKPHLRPAFTTRI